MRALQLLSERSGHRVPTIVRLSKQIPAAAGLGGGSSDAAAALVGANRLWKLNWSRARLSELAAELGSDVPFFLHGGPAVCRGRGERIDPLPCLVRQPIVIVKPTASLATAAIYGQVRPADTSRPIEPLLAAWHDRNSAGVARHLFNRLQAPAEVACPQIGRIAAHLDRLPLLGHQLSGSGSAYFAICRSDRQARRIASVLHAGRLGQVYRVHSLRTPSFCLAP